MNIFRIIKSPWWSISMIQNDSNHPWLKKTTPGIHQGIFTYIYIYIFTMAFFSSYRFSGRPYPLVLPKADVPMPPHGLMSPLGYEGAWLGQPTWHLARESHLRTGVGHHHNEFL